VPNVDGHAASITWRLGDGGCSSGWSASANRRAVRRDILFADLEASGALSRRLSSRGYFDLIRDLTGLIDSSVIASAGIIGKHAGDGGSALFLVEDYDRSESTAAKATIDAARVIRETKRRASVRTTSNRRSMSACIGARR
jgi:class 3 adenylate cyclase